MSSFCQCLRFCFAYACHETCKTYPGKVFSYMKSFKTRKITKEGFGRLINFREEFCLVIVGHIIPFSLHSSLAHLNDAFGSSYDIIRPSEPSGNEQWDASNQKKIILTQIVNRIQRMIIGILYFITLFLLYCISDTQTDFDHEQSNRDSSYLASCSIDSADSPLELLEDGRRNVCKFHW